MFSVSIPAVVLRRYDSEGWENIEGKGENGSFGGRFSGMAS
jgi:hypothetical protein